MRLIGNILWFVLFGWWLALMWLLGGLVFAISIIGLPLTRSALELAKMSAFPFGKTVVHVRDLDHRTDGVAQLTGVIGFIFNLLWLLTFGLSLFISFVVAGLIACVTIILIPFGLQAFKLAVVALWPVGRRVKSVDELYQVPLNTV